MTDSILEPIITENLEPRKRNLLEEYFREDIEGITLDEYFLKHLNKWGIHLIILDVDN